MSEMRKVLILAYYFPPQGGSGTLRVAKFCKYLQEYGWEPVVITTSFISHYDWGLLHDLNKNLEIYRTYDLYLTLSRLGIIRIFGRSSSNLNNIQKISTSSELISVIKRLLISGIKPTIQNIINLEVNVRSWRFSAYHKACSVIEQGKINAIFTTSPPHLLQSVGYRLAKRYPHLPWIMDLRDLWSQSHLIVGTSSYNKTYLQEQEYLRSADKTLVVTEGIRRLTLKKFSELREDKVFTLTNGYDVDDFRDIKVKFINKKFTLTFIGSWYKARSENSFISALYQLATNSNFLQRIQFRFVGNISADIQKQLAPLADTGFIVFRPQVTHREALSEVLNADVVILIESNLFELKLNHSNKLFEYLGSGKPILAIAPIDGEAAQLIRQERAGIVVDPDNPNEICYGIVDLFNRFEHNPHRDIVLGTYPNYNRKNLTRELANILDEVCAQKILDRE